METVVTSQTTIQEMLDILDAHNIEHPWGWEITMCMLLNGCKQLRITGYGHTAKFIREGECDNVTTSEI